MVGGTEGAWALGKQGASVQWGSDPSRMPILVKAIGSGE